MKPIYSFEDDESIRELVLYALTGAGFEAQGFETAKDLYQALSQQQPALLLLDVMLPDESGLHVLERLKANPDTAQIPVILLTAKSAEYDKVLGLDSGADDYIAKPFGVMELLSRVRAVLRRAKPEQSDEIRMGGLALSPKRRQVTADGQEIALTYKEFELLHLLLRNPGLVFTRDQLLSSIWGEDYLGEVRTVDVHIKTLRKKLGPCASLIETVRGVGYKCGGRP